MSKKEEAIATTGGPITTAIAARPSFIPESRNGQEQIGFKDLVVPRLGLCQSNSKARKASSDRFIPGLQEGEFYNSLTKEKYGNKLTFVPLFFYRSRIMFKDMNEGGGIICQAPDGKSCQLNDGGPCLHANWGPKGEPPECNEFFNYPSLIYKGEGPERTHELIIISLKTTGLEAGKQLNSFMRMRGAASYAGVYELGSVAAQNASKQDYFKYTVKNNEAPQWVDTELYKYADNQFKIVKEGILSGTIVVDVDEDEQSNDAFASRDSEV